MKFTIDLLDGELLHSSWWCCPLQPFQMRYFVFISNQKSCYLCAYHIGKHISFRNHMNKKVVVGKHNVLVHYGDISEPDPSGVVVCNPFKWDILCSFLIKNLVIFVPSTTEKWISFHTQDQNSCSRQTQCSSTLCEC